MSEAQPAPTEETLRIRRWYVCYRKRPMPRDEAEALARAIPKTNIGAYECPVQPEHWHIGRSTDGAYEGWRANDRIKKNAKTRYRYETSRGFLSWRGEQRPLPSGAQLMFPRRKS